MYLPEDFKKSPSHHVVFFSLFFFSKIVPVVEEKSTAERSSSRQKKIPNDLFFSCGWWEDEGILQGIDFIASRRTNP